MLLIFNRKKYDFFLYDYCLQCVYVCVSVCLHVCVHVYLYILY